MNIFIKELKGNIKSLIIWSVIILLFVMVGFSKFSAYAGNPELLVILDNMPQAVLESLSLKAFDLTTVPGFYGIMHLYFCFYPFHRCSHVGQRFHFQRRT